MKGEERKHDDDDTGDSAPISQTDQKLLDEDEHEKRVEEHKEEIWKSIDEFKFVLEHEILPDMKKNFHVRKRMALFDDLTFSMITCTENLYKVFERC
jgi:hypothetical protein